MTIKTLLKNVPHVQGIMTVSVWDDGEEIERVCIEADDHLTVRMIEEAGKGLSRLPILYLFARYDELVVEVDGAAWKK